VSAHLRGVPDSLEADEQHTINGNLNIVGAALLGKDVDAPNVSRPKGRLQGWAAKRSLVVSTACNQDQRDDCQNGSM
jgi:hypothetical protein